MGPLRVDIEDKVEGEGMTCGRWKGRGRGRRGIGEVKICIHIPESIVATACVKMLDSVLVIHNKGMHVCT